MCTCISQFSRLAYVWVAAGGAGALVHRPEASTTQGTSPSLGNKETC